MQTTVETFYYKLDRNQRTNFRKNVQELSGMNYNQFFYRLKNNSWSKLELEMMNELVANTKYELVKEVTERTKSKIQPMEIDI
jgi:hypothetical protein